MGWNDVGYQGSEIKTPAIDRQTMFIGPDGLSVMSWIFLKSFSQYHWSCC